MAALDTSEVVRLIVGDDAKQARAAEKLVAAESCTRRQAGRHPGGAAHPPGAGVEPEDCQGASGITIPPSLRLRADEVIE